MRRGPHLAGSFVVLLTLVASIGLAAQTAADRALDEQKLCWDSEYPYGTAACAKNKRDFFEALANRVYVYSGVDGDPSEADCLSRRSTRIHLMFSADGQSFKAESVDTIALIGGRAGTSCKRGRVEHVSRRGKYSRDATWERTVIASDAVTLRLGDEDQVGLTFFENARFLRIKHFWRDAPGDAVFTRAR